MADDHHIIIGPKSAQYVAARWVIKGGNWPPVALCRFYGHYSRPAVHDTAGLFPLFMSQRAATYCVDYSRPVLLIT